MTYLLSLLLTPAMVSLLAEHFDASDALDAAADAGLAIRGRRLDVPAAALPALVNFLQMRAEICEDARMARDYVYVTAGEVRTTLALQDRVLRAIGEIPEPARPFEIRCCDWIMVVPGTGETACCGCGTTFLPPRV